MQRTYIRYKTTALSLFSGFTATALLAFSITHTGIAYLTLLWRIRSFCRQTAQGCRAMGR